MRNRNTHDVTYKKKLTKCARVFRAFSDLQLRYGELLDRDDEILEIKANVLLKGFELGETFTTDFVNHDVRKLKKNLESFLDL